jgi:hypothetical protein
MHDSGGEQSMIDMDTRGWILFVERILAKPWETHGRDYGPWADKGFGVIARFQHDWAPGGTIPTPDKYDDFAQRVGNYVAASQGCHIWLIGNEPNLEWEWPQGQPITPEQYAQCYAKCWQQIHSRPGHENDQVVAAAVGPWNIRTKYPGNESGDWVQYFGDMLAAIREQGVPVDAISVHTYTQDYDPHRDLSDLVFSEVKMEDGFDRYYKHFRAYQDFMRAIPRDLRRVPVYLTEANRNGPWTDHNTGWIQNAYREINDWNSAPGNQQIRCLILYRWADDEYFIKGKDEVIKDWRSAMGHKYVWHEETTTPPIGTMTSLVAKVAKPSIEDITDQLAVHASKRYDTRSLDQIRYLVIHHSAVHPNVGPRRFARHHVDKLDLPGIVYHYVIGKGGRIWQTNALTTVPLHARPVNVESIGICLCGNLLTASPWAEQLDALARLCAWLLDELGLASAEEAIKGRKEFILNNPDYSEWSRRDPGDEWDAGARWRDTLLAKVAALQEAARE